MTILYYYCECLLFALLPGNSELDIPVSSIKSRLISALLQYTSVGPFLTENLLLLDW
jgi:hypothetical protein